MLLRNTLLTFCLVAAVGSTASAQVKLERKYHEGKSSTLDVTSRVDQKLTIAGMDVETKADTQTIVKSTTGKRAENGQLRVQEKVQALQLSIKAGGAEYLFDSANPDKAGASPLEILRKVHQVLARRTSTKVFDKDNKITAIEFDEDGLNGLDENVRNLVKSEFDVEKLKKAANEDLQELTSEPVSKGESWERTSKANLGAGQVMTFSTRYTYEGEVEKAGRKLDKIVSKVLTVEFALEDSPLPLALKSSELKPAESKGEILFDRALGAVVESTSTINIKGDITFTANGTDLPSKLDLTIESRIQRKE